MDSDSFLLEAEDCAEAWRRSRWEEGLYCPACGSGRCKLAGRTTETTYIATTARPAGSGLSLATGTFGEASNVSLRRCVYFAGELDKSRAAEPITEEIGMTKKTARRMAKTIRQALHARCEEWLPKLSGEVEADDVQSKGGSKGAM